MRPLRTPGHSGRSVTITDRPASLDTDQFLLDWQPLRSAKETSRQAAMIVTPPIFVMVYHSTLHWWQTQFSEYCIAVNVEGGYRSEDLSWYFAEDFKPYSVSDFKVLDTRARRRPGYLLRSFRAHLKKESNILVVEVLFNVVQNDVPWPLDDPKVEGEDFVYCYQAQGTNCSVTYGRSIVFGEIQAPTRMVALSCKGNQKNIIANHF